MTADGNATRVGVKRRRIVWALRFELAESLTAFPPQATTRVRAPPRANALAERQSATPTFAEAEALAAAPLPCPRTALAGPIDANEPTRGATGAFGASAAFNVSLSRRGAEWVRHSPHQSSSRTVGHTPSIMYDFAAAGESIGEVRRHCPHCGARLSALPPLRS